MVEEVKKVYPVVTIGVNPKGDVFIESNMTDPRLTLDLMLQAGRVMVATSLKAKEEQIIKEIKKSMPV